MGNLTGHSIHPDTIGRLDIWPQWVWRMQPSNIQEKSEIVWNTQSIKWKKLMWKVIYYVIWNMWHSGKGQTMETVERPVVAKHWKKGANRCSAENFRAAKLLCYCRWIYIIRLSKPTECTILQMSPTVCYELWVTMMYQCRFIHFNKCTTLVGGVDNGDISGGKGVYGNFVFSAKLCFEHKTAPKNSIARSRRNLGPLKIWMRAHQTAWVTHLESSKHFKKERIFWGLVITMV